jgi:hypothetical protein
MSSGFVNWERRGTARSASRATTAFTFLGDVTPKAVDATCLATEQQLRAQAVAAAKTGRATPTSVDDTADGAILPATSRPVAGSTVDGQPRFVLAGKVPAGHGGGHRHRRRRHRDPGTVTDRGRRLRAAGER